MATQKLKVLLTGATGFVGAHVLDRLIQSKLYRVVTPVRSLQKSYRLQERYAADLQSQNLVLVTIPDLTASHALDDVLKQFQPSFIIHLASPFFTTTENPLSDLVQPAVEATRNVMLSALRQGGPALKRLTLLSSFASVVDLSKNPRPGYTYTAADWDPVTEEQAAQNGVLGYHASKTFAEREAWNLHQVGVDTKQPVPAGFDLVTFCPPMIYGPPIHYSPKHLPEKGVEGLNTSTARLILGVTGKDPAFAPKVATPGLPAWIDVRDVAKAIAASLKLNAGTSERILLCAGVDYYEDGMGRLRARGEQGLGELGRKCNVSDHFGIDRSKMESVLGMQDLISLDRTIEDTYDAVKGLGLL